MRAAQSIMADLASAGLTPEQLSLVIELSAAVAVEARPIVDQAAERRRAKDRDYQAAKRRESRPISADSPTLNGFPHEVNTLPPSLSPTNSNELASPDPILKPEHVVEAWNATAERFGLRAIRKLTPERRRKLASRIKQNTIEDFTEAIASIERSPFLRGENDRGWRADFDWMLEPKNFTKLTEGTYDR